MIKSTNPIPPKMDSMEQERQGEEGKKNPTEQKQTAHTFTEKGREGISAVALACSLAADFGQRGHWTGNRRRALLMGRQRTEASSSTYNPRLKRQLSE